jgi:hypothetical protein
MSSQPVGNRDSGTVGIVFFFFVSITFSAALLTLTRCESPVDDNAVSFASVLAVGIRPVLDTINLLNHLHRLLSGVLLLIAVSASLVVLATVMNPDALRDLAGAKLVPAENMGDQLATIRIRITILHIFTRDVEVLVAAASSRNRGRSWGILLSLLLSGSCVVVVGRRHGEQVRS